VKVLYLIIPAGIVLILFLSFSFLNSNEPPLSDIESKIYPSSLDGVSYKKMQLVEIEEDQAFAQKFNILYQEEREYYDNQNQVRHSISYLEHKDSRGAEYYFEFNPSRFELLDTNGIPLDFDRELVKNLDAEQCKSTKRGNYSGFSMFAILCQEQNYIFQISSFTQLENIQETFSIGLAKEMLDKIHSQNQK